MFEGRPNTPVNRGELASGPLSSYAERKTIFAGMRRIIRQRPLGMVSVAAFMAGTGGYITGAISGAERATSLHEPTFGDTPAVEQQTDAYVNPLDRVGCVEDLLATVDGIPQEAANQICDERQERAIQQGHDYANRTASHADVDLGQ